jgi:hypothetical protein
LLHLGHRSAIALVVVLLAGVFACAALAWSQYYVQNAVYSANDGQRSAYNSNLAGNAISFSNPYGGSPQMCSDYVNGNGQNINSPVCHPYGWIDPRTVAYGAAHCWADSTNQYAALVNYCYTNN